MIKIALINIVLPIFCYYVGVICGRESMLREIVERGLVVEVEQDIQEKDEDSDIPQIIHAGYTDAECGREK